MVIFYHWSPLSLDSVLPNVREHRDMLSNTSSMCLLLIPFLHVVKFPFRDPDKENGGKEDFSDHTVTLFLSVFFA